MSAEKIAQTALKEAVRLGIIESVAKMLLALVQGKPSLAARLAQNDALAAAALLKAERRQGKR